MGSADENVSLDVDLCYKALGLSYSDPPERVEKAYASLKEKYTRDMQSSDLAARKNAPQELKQLDELYKTITESLVYKDYAREYEKQRQKQEAERQEKLQKKQAEKTAIINCPYCGKLISRSITTCPYCNKKQSSSQGITIAIIVAIIVVMVVAALAVLNK
jgi:hypothetical protein